MYRRHTTGGESWSVCPYYYTHNNGSSDDILLPYKSLKIPNIKTRRNSCPTELQLEQKQQLEQEEEEEEQKDDFSLNRKSTIKSKKRETLANILSNMSRKENEDHLDKKWQSMDLKMSSLRTNTTLCEINDTAIDIESIESEESIRSVNAPLRPDVTTSPIPGAIRVEDDESQQNEEKEEDEDYGKLDMWLFLFGFLCFPLWWISAWRYFTHPKSNNGTKKKKKNPKAKIFQVINLWMTLGSLILLGLMVGLTVTFAT